MTVDSAPLCDINADVPPITPDEQDCFGRLIALEDVKGQAVTEFLAGNFDTASELAADALKTSIRAQCEKDTPFMHERVAVGYYVSNLIRIKIRESETTH